MKRKFTVVITLLLLLAIGSSTLAQLQCAEEMRVWREAWQKSLDSNTEVVRVTKELEDVRLYSAELVDYLDKMPADIAADIFVEEGAKLLQGELYKALIKAGATEAAENFLRVCRVQLYLMIYCQAVEICLKSMLVDGMYACTTESLKKYGSEKVKLYVSVDKLHELLFRGGLHKLLTRLVQAHKNLERDGTALEKASKIIRDCEKGTPMFTLTPKITASPILAQGKLHELPLTQKINVKGLGLVFYLPEKWQYVFVSSGPLGATFMIPSVTKLKKPNGDIVFSPENSGEYLIRLTLFPRSIDAKESLVRFARWQNIEIDPPLFTIKNWIGSISYLRTRSFDEVYGYINFGNESLFIDMDAMPGEADQAIKHVMRLLETFSYINEQGVELTPTSTPIRSATLTQTATMTLTPSSTFTLTPKSVSGASIFNQLPLTMEVAMRDTGVVFYLPEGWRYSNNALSNRPGLTSNYTVYSVKDGVGIYLASFSTFSVAEVEKGLGKSGLTPEQFIEELAKYFPKDSSERLMINSTPALIVRNMESTMTGVGGVKLVESSGFIHLGKVIVNFQIYSVPGENDKAVEFFMPIVRTLRYKGD